MIGRQIRGFGAYVDGLERLAADVLLGFPAQNKLCNIKGILDGEVAREFRTRIPVRTRRRTGAFFTSAKLARRLSGKVLSNLPANAVIADPACGVGDLLLGAAGKLPTRENVAQTLQVWGERLMGFDVQPEFVRATKARLLLLAMLRSSRIERSAVPKLSGLFPMIYVHDFLAAPEELEGASHILINPPYNELMAPSECTWGNRRVSAAAMFMDACISNASGGAEIGAILPDVLRSGSYYERWREHIESTAEELEIKTCGQFDNWTDVDVFFLRLVKGHRKKEGHTMWWPGLRQPHNGKVADHFKVHVGAVVPHRDAQKGPCVAYIHAKTLPAWGEVKRIDERRKFSGTLFEPPFVAVRRTSRPGDKRAIATVIKGKRKVAVENHIIALFPNRSTISECKELLRVLKSSDTDRWLNNRIRCRHLTVQSLRDLPWWSKDK